MPDSAAPVANGESVAKNAGARNATAWIVDAGDTMGDFGVWDESPTSCQHDGVLELAHSTLCYTCGVEPHVANLFLVYDEVAKRLRMDAASDDRLLLEMAEVYLRSYKR